MRSTYAYSFETNLTLGEILEVLHRRGLWRWVRRDNDSWGDYISAAALGKPHKGVLKIIPDGDQRQLLLPVSDN